MTLAEAAPPPLDLASWNLCVLGVVVAGDTMHAEFVPTSQCRHLAIVACVDSLCAIRTPRRAEPSGPDPKGPNPVE